MNFILLGVGLLGGVVFTWLLMKGKVALAAANARGGSEIERTSLTEQLKAAAHEVADTKARLRNAEGEAQTLRGGMDELGRECAQLTERASRLAVVEKLKLDLEHAAEAVKSELAKYRESNGRLAGDVEAKKQRLSEVEQACQRLSTERDSLMNDQIGLTSKIAVNGESYRLKDARRRREGNAPGEAKA